MRAAIEDGLLAQRGGLIGWVPVCLGIGIGVYFSLQFEPSRTDLTWVCGIAAVFYVISRKMTASVSPLFIAVALVFAGFGAAQWHSAAVAEPVLDFRYYGPIQGRVIDIDRSASDAPRLTLDQVVLARMAPGRTPTRARVSVHAEQVITHYEPGDTLIMTGHLSPPAGPAEPGGFDFQRHAWFMGLGAVGYTRTPVLRLDAPATPSWSMRIFAMRMRISTAVQNAIPGQTGGFAAAIMTGDRSAMAQDTLANLRAANLAHLLAISGLHMGLLTGFIFATVRYCLAFNRTISLWYPTKKIAALCALVVGAFYLALSGGNVATERAFIMVAVMFVAVLLDRRALTLRAVAMAAIVVLVRAPDALMGPGFQMSFAATTALVVVFGALRRFNLTRWPKWTRGILSVVMSSLIAGLATAPFAAAHFNQISHFGLIANLLSVPLMGVVVMPAAVLAVCLAPIGLSQIGFWVMAQGLRWILMVADKVAHWDGAVGHVVAPGPSVLPLMAIGLLWAVLWQGRLRWLGTLCVATAIIMWTQAGRPAVLVADSGALVGVMGPSGRALSKPTGDSFVAQIWLENDGAPVDQAVAASRDGYSRDGRVVSMDVGGWQIVQVAGKTALAQLSGCDGADVLISNQADEEQRPCLVFDINTLRSTGALAFTLDDDGSLVITTAHGVAGQRPWNANQGRAHAATVIPITQQQGRPELPLLTAHAANQ